MEKVAEVFKFIVENWAVMFAGFVAVLAAVIALLKAFIAFMKVIPGEQGETLAQKIVDALQKVVDFVGGAPKEIK